jgi:photosystem II stability/assembly factor-like uncharacterized protein
MKGATEMKNAKKLFSLILAAVLAFSLFNTPALAADSAGIIAAPIQNTLSVDGKSVSLWAYEIGGGMYFKLRDLAMALSGTEKQFDISWTFDSDYRGIDLLFGRAYMSIGGELSAPSNQGKAVAVLSTASFYCDGGRPAMPAYLIGGAHYVKLSDLAATLKFASDWDEENHTAKIDTSPEITSAEPTGKAFDNIALTHARNSYSLDKDGNVTLSYHNGVTTIQAPLKSSTGDFYSVYISDDKTAIAYGGGDEPFQVLISDDMGKTWNTYAVESARYLGANRYIGFITQEDGFLVASPGSSSGTSYNFVFETSDGGKTWTQIGNPNDLYPCNATGAGFSTKNIGFISYRVDNSPGPTIYRTMDGGYTWEKLEVTVPSEYDYNIPLSPVFPAQTAFILLSTMFTTTTGATGASHIILPATITARRGPTTKHTIWHVSGRKR